MLITTTVLWIFVLVLVMYAWRSTQRHCEQLKAQLADIQADHDELLSNLPRVYPDTERELWEAKQRTAMLENQLHHAQVILAALQEVPQGELNAIEDAMTTLQVNIYRVRHRALLATTLESPEYSSAMRGYQPGVNDPTYQPSNLNSSTLEP